MVDGWESLAKALVAAGRTKEAIAAFGKAIEVDPLKPEPHLALARIYALERQPSLARQHAELGSQRDPGQGYEILAELMMDAGRPREAAADARRSLRGRSLAVHESLPARRHRAAARAVRRSDRAFRAGDRGQTARAAGGRPKSSLRRLRTVSREPAATADAEREFKAELAAIADSAEARVGLATLYKSQGREGDARASWRISSRAHRIRPPNLLDGRPHAHRARRTARAREWASRAATKFPRDSEVSISKRVRRMAGTADVGARDMWEAAADVRRDGRRKPASLDGDR